MSTISENLQIIKNSADAIKQAIIDKGGTISGDITTWADAISGISSGGELDLITFYLGSTNDASRICPRGMTWAEYVESVFNTKDYYYGSIFTDPSDIMRVDNGGYIMNPETADYSWAEETIYPLTYSIHIGSGGSGN